MGSAHRRLALSCGHGVRCDLEPVLRADGEYIWSDAAASVKWLDLDDDAPELMFANHAEIAALAAATILPQKNPAPCTVYAGSTCGSAASFPPPLPAFRLPLNHGGR